MDIGKYLIYLKDLKRYRLTEPSRSAYLLVDPEVQGSKTMSMGLCIIDPHSSIPYHEHKIEEVIYIFKGNGKVKIEDREYEAGAGTAMFMPPEIPHQIINTADEELHFVFVYSPPGTEQAVKTNYGKK